MSLFSQFSTFSSKIGQYAIVIAPYFNCKPKKVRHIRTSMESIHDRDAHHQATCHAFNTMPHLFTRFCVTVVVRILVALANNRVTLLFPACTNRMRSGMVRRWVIFLTVGKRLSQPPRAGVVVRQYFAVQESQILLTTGIDPQSAYALCDFNFIVTKRDKDNYSLLNFSPKGLDIFAICSSSSGGQGVTKRKRVQKKVRIKRRIVADQVRGLIHIYISSAEVQTPTQSLMKIGPPGGRCGKGFIPKRTKDKPNKQSFFTR